MCFVEHVAEEVVSCLVGVEEECVVWWGELLVVYCEWVVGREKWGECGRDDDEGHDDEIRGVDWIVSD